MITPTALPRKLDNELIDRIERALNALERLPLNNVVILANLAIGNTDTRVYHGLGRSVAGYFIVRASIPCAVSDGNVPETLDPSNYVTLRLSSAATVTLAVY